MQSMEIGATIQQYLDHFPRGSGHSPMQGCTPGAVAQVQELRLCIEERLHTPDIPGGSGHMDGVVGFGWLDTAPTGTSLFKQLGHAIVTPIAGNGEQLFAAVRTRIEQNLCGIEVSLAHRKVERLVVFGQLRVTLEQAALYLDV